MITLNVRVKPNSPELKIVSANLFITDIKIVATGSFNPAKSAGTRNDENLLILHSPAVAERFLGEFELVFGNSTK